MNNKKLYRLIDDFQLPNYFSSSRQEFISTNVKSLPFMCYPNGIPCYEVNSYLLFKLKFGYSQINGGTYKIFSNHLSHFIRFTFNNKNIIRFTQYNNDFFSEFLDYLQENNQIRSNNQIIRIAHQAIDFLFFVSDLYNLDNFIGVGKNFKISLTFKRKPKSTYYKKLNFQSGYYHYSFPPPSPRNKRYPVSLDNYNRLLEYLNCIDDEGLRLRNLSILQALESTGGRRTEVCSLSMVSLRSALKSDSESPLIELIKLKNSYSHNTRLIPVSRALLLNLRFYVQYYRNPIMKIKNIHHDYVFISHTSGKPLNPDSLTTYMRDWSIEAKLSNKVCAHMFRHRFITEKFKALILDHELSSNDDFRKVLLNTNRLKQIMLEWTGHSSISSLDDYIDLAFEELTDIQKLKENVLNNSKIYFMKEHIEFLSNSLSKGSSLDLKILSELLENLK